MGILVLAEQHNPKGPEAAVDIARKEQRVLIESTVLTAAIAGAGILLGLLSGSMAIVFDGLFSFIDMAMSLLALFVARLVLRESNRRFQYGYWHIEPMALAFNGGMLMLLCIYALVNAIGSLAEGGQDVSLGWAIGYSAAMAAVSFAMYAYERRVNRQVRSQLLTLDIQSWLMTALVAAALLVAFLVAWWLEGTSLAYIAPYVDPGILAILSLALAFMPVKTVRQALAEVLLMTPAELDETVRAAMDDVIARHGFLGYTSYAAKVGRGRFIEIHIVVPSDRELGTVDVLDGIRDEIAVALNAEGPEEWLTIDFTGQEEWT